MCYTTIMRGGEYEKGKNRQSGIHCKETQAIITSRLSLQSGGRALLSRARHNHRAVRKTMLLGGS